ncbi:hypothetical protein FISHEDRAFT_64877 [Fistulina hepatica ATCC 64428]|uniref:GTP binding protein 2 n=1 Tax=Fistulina hepatica ATCC 64428 TaxID=1128425 RepID=A0A0D7AIP7_9AGAR|nr:hypothetical protein FISHEDRAFT_64877 [Fistulina hepatica ATCC 64428]
MFGESDSESPRVPSPWDSLVSSSASPSPSPLSHGASPASITSIPKLVAESDDGNVEYKLQLLNPSPARFARLVTQLKWRLLEGGGQAYYELGVADSGALVGLSRNEMEQSLETLEMMAGEIGASVIVVKEVEVPASIIGLVALEDSRRKGSGTNKLSDVLESEDSFTISSTTETETEPETDTTNDLENDLAATIVLDSNAAPLPAFGVWPTDNSGIFDFDDIPAPAGSDLAPPKFAIDLAISSVYKPRPMRTRRQHILVPASPAKKKKRHREGRDKKLKYLNSPSSDSPQGTAEEIKRAKAIHRREIRDKRRKERDKALMACAVSSMTAIDESNAAPATATLPPVSDIEVNDTVADLEYLHVAMGPPPGASQAVDDTGDTVPVVELTSQNDDDDVFPSPIVPFNGTRDDERDGIPRRLIVEALVVRKTSLHETFLDFECFSIP